MGKGKEVSFNVSKLLFLFFAFVKTSLCGKFKKFKTNKAILTIAIKRKESNNDENILRKYFSPKEKNYSEICLGLVFGSGFELMGRFSLHTVYTFFLI